ncbi:MAG: hydrogenase iron-sulfur subunit [Candidatus Bathyarchaeota archaeon]|nr:MAG: hydrogenase iron-sulfur subunit [Candidatus Bathyarchaeota archaeon]
MNEVGTLGIKLDDTFCGRCSICSSICPYDAISEEPKTGEIKIDTEKCQFCGICYSACPVKAIEVIYYDYDSLLKRVEASIIKSKADSLILMCRGNSPPTCEVEDILKIGADNYVPLRVPCVGRIPPQFLFKALTIGINSIIAIRCEEDFCRFKDGSRINNQRLLLTKQVLRELGYEDDRLRLVTYARKAVYDTDKCVGCDKCVFICPYEAIEVEDFATPKVNFEKCVGCGSCALVCPHLAIQVEGFEYETVSHRLRRYGAAIEELKSQDKSPLILVFCCQWSEFSILDHPEGLFNNKALVLEIPCFKGLDPYLVIEALHVGFDGVLAVVCSNVDCKLEEGYDVAEQNVRMLYRVLKEMGLQDRFAIHTGSPRTIDKFVEHLKSFLEKINTLSRQSSSTSLTFSKGGTSA